MRTSENIKMPEEMREMVFVEKKTKFKNNLRSNGKDAMGQSTKNGVIAMRAQYFRALWREREIGIINA